MGRSTSQLKQQELYIIKCVVFFFFWVEKAKQIANGTHKKSKNNVDRMGHLFDTLLFLGH